LVISIFALSLAPFAGAFAGVAGVTAFGLGTGVVTVGGKTAGAFAAALGRVGETGGGGGCAIDKLAIVQAITQTKMAKIRWPLKVAAHCVTSTTGVKVRD